MQINGGKLYGAEEQPSQRPCSGSKLGVLVYWGHQKGQYGLRKVREPRKIVGKESKRQWDSRTHTNQGLLALFCTKLGALKVRGAKQCHIQTCFFKIIILADELMIIRNKHIKREMCQKATEVIQAKGDDSSNHC